MGEPRSRKPKLEKHTPGPWKLTPREPGDKEIFIEAAGDGYARLFCSVSCDDCDVPTAKANATLIAAAPELLAELEHAHDMIKHYLKCGYLPHMSAEEAEQLVRNPDSAIRKARGDAADAH